MYVFFMCLFKRMQILFATASVVFLISSCSFKLTPKAKVSESSFDSRTAANSNPVPSCPPEDMGCDGVCFSEKTVDCAGTCDGSAHLDCNGACDGAGVVDCDGTCNGPAEPDCAGTCNGGAKIDCRGDCNFPADDFDRCGVCGGSGNTCPTPSPGSIQLVEQDCGCFDFAVRIDSEFRAGYGSFCVGPYVPPAPGKVCCPFGTKPSTTLPYKWSFAGKRENLHLNSTSGHSATEDECCVKSASMPFDGVFVLPIVSNRLLSVVEDENHFSIANEQKTCCVMAHARIETAQQALASIKHVPIGGGAESTSISEWNGNLPSKLFGGAGAACLPGCSSTTQNETLKGSADPLFPKRPGTLLLPQAQACCRVSCTGNDSVDFAFSPIGTGSTCTPTTGVNGNDKGVCLPCPECEYKKQLPSVLTPPCTHDQLLAERSQGKVPLCEKVPEVCTVPQ